MKSKKGKGSLKINELSKAAKAIGPNVAPGQTNNIINQAIRQNKIEALTNAVEEKKNAPQEMISAIQEIVQRPNITPSNTITTAPPIQERVATPNDRVPSPRIDIPDSPQHDRKVSDEDDNYFTELLRIRRIEEIEKLGIKMASPRACSKFHELFATEQLDEIIKILERDKSKKLDVFKKEEGGISCLHLLGMIKKLNTVNLSKVERILDLLSNYRNFESAINERSDIGRSPFAYMITLTSFDDKKVIDETIKIWQKHRGKVYIGTGNDNCMYSSWIDSDVDIDTIDGLVFEAGGNIYNDLTGYTNDGHSFFTAIITAPKIYINDEKKDYLLDKITKKLGDKKVAEILNDSKKDPFNKFYDHYGSNNNEEFVKGIHKALMLGAIIPDRFIERIIRDSVTNDETIKTNRYLKAFVIESELKLHLLPILEGAKNNPSVDVKTFISSIKKIVGGHINKIILSNPREFDRFASIFREIKNLIQKTSTDNKIDNDSVERVIKAINENIIFDLKDVKQGDEREQIRKIMEKVDTANRPTLEQIDSKLENLLSELQTSPQLVQVSSTSIQELRGNDPRGGNEASSLGTKQEINTPHSQQNNLDISSPEIRRINEEDFALTPNFNNLSASNSNKQSPKTSTSADTINGDRTSKNVNNDLLDQIRRGVKLNKPQTIDTQQAFKANTTFGTALNNVAAGVSNFLKDKSPKKDVADSNDDADWNDDADLNTQAVTNTTTNVAQPDAKPSSPAPIKTQSIEEISRDLINEIERINLSSSDELEESNKMQKLTKKTEVSLYIRSNNDRQITQIISSASQRIALTNKLVKDANDKLAAFNKLIGAMKDLTGDEKNHIQKTTKRVEKFIESIKANTESTAKNDQSLIDEINTKKSQKKQPTSIQGKGSSPDLNINEQTTTENQSPEIIPTPSSPKEVQQQPELTHSQLERPKPFRLEKHKTLKKYQTNFQFANNIADPETKQATENNNTTSPKFPPKRDPLKLSTPTSERISIKPPELDVSDLISDESDSPSPKGPSSPKK